MNTTDLDLIKFRLPTGQEVTFDKEDTDLAQLRWALTGRGYAVRTVCVDGKPHSIYMHRVILERMIGRPLFPNEQCDHINCDRLDNRRKNLRPATRAENQQNRSKQKNNKTGLKGAYPFRNKFQSQIRVNRQVIFLGVFDTAEDAHAAYCAAAQKYHGEFARG